MIILFIAVMNVILNDVVLDLVSVTSPLPSARSKEAACQRDGQGHCHRLVFPELGLQVARVHAGVFCVSQYGIHLRTFFYERRQDENGHTPQS